MLSMLVCAGRYRYHHDNKSEQVIPRNHKHHSFRKVRNE